MRFRPGNANTQIVIQQNTPTRGTSGSSIASWATYITRRAELINHAVSTESEQDKKTTSTEVLMFLIRYDSGVNKKMRVVYNSRNWEIIGIKNIKERNTDLLLTIREIK